MPAGSNWRLHLVTVPVGTADVTPLVEFGRLTGDLVWVNGSGRLGWSRNDQSAQLTDVEGTRLWQHFRPRVVPLDDQDVVAVFGSTATIARPPTGDTVFADAPQDQQPHGPLRQWRLDLVHDSLGSAPYAGADPIRDECTGTSRVVLPGQFTDRGGLLVSASSVQRLTGGIILADNCTVLTTDASLDVYDQFGLGPVVVQDPLRADVEVPSPDGSRVALLRDGRPIEVLLTAQRQELPRPWDITWHNHGVLAAFGTRQVLVDWHLHDSGLVFVEDSGPHRVTLPDAPGGAPTMLGVQPDGSEAVVKIGGRKNVTLVEANGKVLTSPSCRDFVGYMPAPGFAESTAASEGQVPVGLDDVGTRRDCRTGATNTFDGTVTHVDAYDVGTTSGLLVVRRDRRLTVTTWSRPSGALTTVNGPAAVTAETTLSTNPPGDRLIAWRPGSHRADIYVRQGDAWRPTLRINPGEPDVAAVALVDGGTLVATVGAKGAFELYDADSGRLVASDDARDTPGYSKVVSIASSRQGDNLFIQLTTQDGLTSGGSIRVPISIPGLRHQLCGVYAAPGCPSR
jgi:hypothetical protein